MSNFPTGEFYIRNVATGFVLDVANSATAPGSRVIVWPRNTPQSRNQLWRYENGFLVNFLSGLVLEVPGFENGGRITPGTRLVVSPRREAPTNINQVWAYNVQIQTLAPYDPNVRITAGGTTAGPPAVVETIQLDNPAFQWTFLPVPGSG